MLVVSHFIPVNSVQLNRCGCLLMREDIFLSPYVLTHRSRGVSGEMMPSLMCLFAGDGAKRNSDMRRDDEEAAEVVALRSTCENPRRSTSASVSASRTAPISGLSSFKKYIYKIKTTSAAKSNTFVRKKAFSFQKKELEKKHLPPLPQPPFPSQP